MSSILAFVNLKASGNSFAVFAIILLVIVILRELFLFQSRQKPVIYYVFLFPGIIIHELSHTLVCLSTFTPIHSIKLFSKDGGFVLHKKPRFAFISFLISIAPLCAGLIIIYFAISAYDLLNASAWQTAEAKNIVVLYFLSSILLTMLPSRQDIINAFSSFIAISLGIGLYYFLSNNSRFFDKINLLLLFSLLLLGALNLSIVIINKLWKSK